ncbi:hypothetical protein MRBBS_3793 [Marinobacter sp. BSs20148]|nr:hypothetical protein MRBBS_3793 [Marinobacter sp. BSs20148]
MFPDFDGAHCYPLRILQKDAQRRQHWRDGVGWSALLRAQYMLLTSINDK